MKLGGGRKKRREEPEGWQKRRRKKCEGNKADVDEGLSNPEEEGEATFQIAGEDEEADG